MLHFCKFASLVPKLQLGNAHVPEAPCVAFFSEDLFFDSKQSFWCNYVPKQEPGNEVANERTMQIKARLIWIRKR